MDFFKETIIKYIKEFIIVLETIGLITLAIFLHNKQVCVPQEFQSEITPIIEEVATTQEPKKIKIDIKGAVKNPGVYEVIDSNNVSDVITLAGGLKKTADTSNLNLSRKVTDQMVIKVFTSTEIKKLDNSKTEETTSCISNTVVIDSCKDSSIVEVSESEADTNTSSVTQNKEQTEPGNGLISLNTATLEQLMSLSGIGESKAKSIIEYREKVGSFTKIEDVMNVSGIGESVFNKIKDYITV